MENSSCLFTAVPKVAKRIYFCIRYDTPRPQPFLKNCCSSTIVSIRHPPTPPCPTHPCLPFSNLPLLALSMCPLYMFLDGPSPIIPNYPSPPSSLLTVSLFIISMSLVVFCLLVLLIVFFLLLFKYSCLHFHPIMAPGPTHPHLPTLNLPPLALSMCPSYMFLDGPSSDFPHYPSPPSALVTVNLFFISMFLVIFCLFVLLIRFYL